MTRVIVFLVFAAGMMNLASSSAHAETFDPFNPRPSLSSNAPISTKANDSQAVTASVVVPSPIIRASTPVGPPKIYISVGNAPTVQQSKTAKTFAHFAVKLSQASKSKVSFHYMTVDGSGGVNEDYIARSGYLAFNPNQTVIYIDVSVVPEAPETEAYKNETFFLKITSVTNAIVSQDTGEAHILSSK